MRIAVPYVAVSVTIAMQMLIVDALSLSLISHVVQIAIPVTAQLALALSSHLTIASGMPSHFPFPVNSLLAVNVFLPPQVGSVDDELCLIHNVTQAPLSLGILFLVFIQNLDCVLAVVVLVVDVHTLIVIWVKVPLLMVVVVVVISVATALVTFRRRRVHSQLSPSNIDVPVGPAVRRGCGRLLSCCR